MGDRAYYSQQQQQQRPSSTGGGEGGEGERRAEDEEPLAEDVDQLHPTTDTTDEESETP